MIKRFIKRFVLVFIVVIVVLMVWSRYNPGIGLGNGYRLIDVRPDDVHIIKNDKAIVLSTIVDYHEDSNFIAGLRFPSINMVCGNSYSIVLTLNKEKFFLLNKQNDRLIHFNSQLAFEEKLAEVTTLNSVLLDYSKFETIRKKYSKFNDDSEKSNCKPYPIGTKEYEIYKNPSNN